MPRHRAVLHTGRPRRDRDRVHDLASQGLDEQMLIGAASMLATCEELVIGFVPLPALSS